MKGKKKPAEPKAKKKLKVDIEEDDDVLEDGEEWVYEDRTFEETSKEAKTYEDDEGCLVTEYVPVTRTKTERVKVGKRKIGSTALIGVKTSPSLVDKKEASPIKKQAPAPPPQQAAAPPPPKKSFNNFGAKAKANAAPKKQGTLLNFFGKK